MPGVPELIQTALDLDVKLIACTTTLGLLGCLLYTSPSPRDRG